MEKEPDLVMSPLCQWVTQDGYTVRVLIYGSGEADWILEVVDETGASTVWDDPFATDELAFAEFERTVSAHGIRSFEEDKP
jgi:hypothetical protein